MQKPLQIAYKNLDRSPAFDAIITARAEALDRIFPGLIGCRVVVEAPNKSSDGAKPPIGIAVEVEVARHPTIVGKDAQDQREAKGDHTAPINNAFDAVERQLKRIADGRTTEAQARVGQAAGDTGMVVRLFPEQGYGFVELDKTSELYFTRNAVSGGSFDDLKVGMLVHATKAVAEGPMGPQASSVRLLGKAQSE